MTIFYNKHIISNRINLFPESVKRMYYSDDNDIIDAECPHFALTEFYQIFLKNFVFLDSFRHLCMCYKNKERRRNVAKQEKRSMRKAQ